MRETVAIFALYGGQLVAMIWFAGVFMRIVAGRTLWLPGVFIMLVVAVATMAWGARHVIVRPSLFELVGSTVGYAFVSMATVEIITPRQVERTAVEWGVVMIGALTLLAGVYDLRRKKRQSHEGNSAG